jgi:hypothetical protein
MANNKNNCEVIKTFFDHNGFEALKRISQEEREFAYYMSMAAIAGYPIGLFQKCPHPEILSKISNYLLSDKVIKNDTYEALRIYWLYLFSNYGVHCAQENIKFVPSDLNISLNSESFKNVGIELTEDEEKYLFDKNYFPTAYVSRNIERSGTHFYGKSVTTQIYETLPETLKTKINGYYELKEGNIISSCYSTTQICGEYMTNCIFWFQKALHVAKENPKYFDDHTVNSLDHLIKFYISGDEEDFKSHSKEWLQMKNPNIEYNAGFIEYYADPMGSIGSYQSDVTLKSLNVDALLKMLPSFEEKFPFPREWKRKNMSILPNAASAYKIMGTGDLGPILSTIAYCLPNYNDIRSELGSKQIMYVFPEVDNVERYKQLYFSKDEQKFFDTYSPDLKLEQNIDAFTTTLHETIGHASGANIEGITNEIKSKNTGKWKNGLEEMRAEIIALYTSVFFYDEISECGILGNWSNTVPKEKIFELLIQNIAGGGWKRWKRISVDETKIENAHTLADTGIMYYLIDHSDGGMELIEDTIQYLGSDVNVLRLVIHDLNKVIPVIKELATLVQKLSSTADAKGIDDFMNAYAASTRNIKYSGIVRKMNELLNDGCKINVQVFPEWRNNNGSFVATIPNDPIDATLRMWQLSNPKHFNRDVAVSLF